MRTSWRTIAAMTAVAAALIQFSVGDREALVAGTLLLVAAALLWVRRGRLGAVLLAVLSVNLLVWMAPATWSGARYGSSFGTVALSATLVVLALLGIAAAVGWFRHDGPRAAAAPSVLAAVAVWTAIVLVAGLAGGDPVSARPGDLELTARDLAYDVDELTAGPGPTGIVLHNDDLFWHTFTVDDLDIDLRVPVRGTRRIEVDLPAGTYTFVCGIPGHEAAGMEGTLVVG